MGEGSRKEKPRERRGIKLLAGTQEPIVRVPVVLEPVEVQVPPLAVPVQVRDVAVAVRVLPDQCARYRPRHRPLNILRVESDSGPKKPSDSPHQVASFLRD